MIKLLDSQTIDKIAAGEVVERPLNVVKELVENSIDAGSKNITVEIKGGGIDFIRIADNGCGIPAEEISTAFLRHATSKIHNVQDLESLSTLGFRGEALASISAVSKTTLVSKTKDELCGVMMCVNGGEMGELTQVGAPDGTTVIVESLFYNVPARKKFLKSAVAEGTAIIELCEHLALCNPFVSIGLIVNGQNKFQTKGDGNLKEVIYRIFGKDTASNLIAVSREINGISVEGYIGKPEVNSGTRSRENYFVNQRYIKNESISCGIEEGYKSHMMQHRYPFCVLHINVNSETLDVNVHPSKMLVRFDDKQKVTDSLMLIVSDALHGKEFIPDMESKEEVKTPVKVVAPFELHRQDTDIFNEMPSLKEDRNVFENDSLTSEKESVPVTDKKILFFDEEKPTDTEQISKPAVKTDSTLNDVKEDFAKEATKEIKPVTTDNYEQETFFSTNILKNDTISQIKVIGQLFDTYWLLEYDDVFYMMDQHAAHEKVMYESFMQQYLQSDIVTQNLVIPETIELRLSEMLIYKENADIFNRFGFETEEFGERSVLIRAVPLTMFGMDIKEFFYSVFEEICKDSKEVTNKAIADKIATQACKAAVKGNNSLSFEEVRTLLEKLLKLDNPYQCPHGRPTMIKMSKYEVEKKFKRIV